MYAINDYSNLSVEEAREKIVHLAHRIFAEQFHANFFIKDPRPEIYLKYEIQAFLESRIEEFHGWTDPIGQALDFVYGRLTWWFRDFWYWTIRPGIEWILEGFRWIWESAVEWARYAYNQALEVWYEVRSVYSYLTGTVSFYLSNVYSEVRGLWNTVYSAATSAVSSVQVWVQSSASWLWQQINSVVLPFLREHYLLLAGPVGLTLELVRTFKPYLEVAWNQITEQVSGAFETLSKQVAALPQAISAGFQSAVSYLREVFEKIWNEVLVPFGKQLAEGLQWIAGQLETVFATVVNTLESIFSAIAPVTPERAPNAALNALKVAGIAAGGLLAMTAAWDLIHPIKDVIPGELKAMLYDVTNYKMILGALTGALTAVAIAQPMKYYYNSVFRPYVLSWGDLMELLSRSYIDDETFRRFMRYHGYDDVYFDYFKELANTPVRYFGLAAVARTGYFDEQFFKEELDRSGYSEKAKQVMLQMYQQTANEAVKGYYSSVVISRYREGIIDKDGLNEELKMLGYPERLRKPLVIGAELYYDLDTVKDYITAVRQAYRRGKITIDELRAELASLGIREDRIERIVAIELARAKEEVGTTQEEEVRAYGRGTAIKRFREGLTTETELENELRVMGYSPQWIDRLKLVARLERDYDFAMTVLSTVKRAYRKKKIDDVRFIEILRSFGFTDEKISLELSLLKLELGLGLEGEEVGG